MSNLTNLAELLKIHTVLIDGDVTDTETAVSYIITNTPGGDITGSLGEYPVQSQLINKLTGTRFDASDIIITEIGDGQRVILTNTKPAYVVVMEDHLRSNKWVITDICFNKDFIQAVKSVNIAELKKGLGKPIVPKDPHILPIGSKYRGVEKEYHGIEIIQAWLDTRAEKFPATRHFTGHVNKEVMVDKNNLVTMGSLICLKDGDEYYPTFLTKNDNRMCVSVMTCSKLNKVLSNPSKTHLS